MRRSLYYMLCLTVLSANVACSRQIRESNPELSATDLHAMLVEVQSGEHSGDSGAALAQAGAFLQDQDTTIYFADGPRPKHRLNTVMAFTSLNFLLPPDALKNGPAIAARVFFIDHAPEHQAFLIVGLIQGGSKDEKPGDVGASSDLLYYSFQGKGQVSGGEYSVTFAGADGNPFTLRSRDVKGDALNARIQLRAFTLVHGASVEFGKFPTLTGYQ